MSPGPVQLLNTSTAIGPSFTGAGTVHERPSGDVYVPTVTGKTSGCTFTFCVHAGTTPATGLWPVARPVVTEPASTAVPDVLPADAACRACRSLSACENVMTARSSADMAREGRMTRPPFPRCDAVCEHCRRANFRGARIARSTWSDKHVEPFLLCGSRRCVDSPCSRRYKEVASSPEI